LRGGRLVLGSGSTWPHDFRFLAGLPSALVDAGVDEACDMSCGDEDAGEGVSKGTWRSSILMVVVGAESAGGGVMAPEAIIVGVVIVWEK
jgi:hypothetical protein